MIQRSPLAQWLIRLSRRVSEGSKPSDIRAVGQPGSSGTTSGGGRTMIQRSPLAQWLIRLSRRVSEGSKPSDIRAVGQPGSSGTTSGGGGTMIRRSPLAQWLIRLSRRVSEGRKSSDIPAVGHPSSSGPMSGGGGTMIQRSPLAQWLIRLSRRISEGSKSSDIPTVGHPSSSGPMSGGGGTMIQRSPLAQWLIRLGRRVGGGTMIRRSPLAQWLIRLSENPPRVRRGYLIAIGVTALTTGITLVLLKAWLPPTPPPPPGEAPPFVLYYHLEDLPGVSDKVKAAQRQLLLVAEPFVYDNETKLAYFEVEILSTNGFKSDGWADLLSLDGIINALLIERLFGDETRIAFDGDAQSLDNLVEEIQLVNEEAGWVVELGKGVWNGLKDLLRSLWDLLNDPVKAAADLGDAAIAIAEYVGNTPPGQMVRDVDEFGSAYLMERACEVANGESIQFLDMKTKRGRAIIWAKVGAQLSGQLAFDVALIFAPFSKLAWADKAADVGKVANTAQSLRRAGMARAGADRTARSIQLFPKLQQQTEALAKRASRDSWSWDKVYRDAFFTKHPQLDGKVVIHHAIEQQVLTRYPGVMTEAEIHSLKNLRGIPIALNDDLHLSKIRKEWNKFYRENPPGTVDAKKLLDKAQEIDRKYGHLFNPPITQR
jgi:hypothetical protein